MKKLLGITESSHNFKRIPTIPTYHKTSISPPPLPAQFKVSAFDASRKNEFEEEEKRKKLLQKRLIQSKKENRFRKISQKVFLFQGNMN